MKVLFVALALSVTVGCAKTPPNLSPEASLAFKGTQAVRVLDLLRDTAITANAQVPPLITEAVTRKIVLYHQSSVKVIQASPGGWRPTVQTGLDEVVKNLSPKDKQLLAPYLALLKSILVEVTR